MFIVALCVIAVAAVVWWRRNRRPVEHDTANLPWPFLSGTKVEDDEADQSA